MRETKELVCIVCPTGCRMTAEIEDGKILSITGNSCARGKEYASEEAINPKRSVTTTMKVEGRSARLVSVKTDGRVPKRMIRDVMKACNAVTVGAPVCIGDILIIDVCGTGVNIVATKNISAGE